LCLLLVAGCRSTALAPPSLTDAANALELLDVIPRPSADGLYRRADFGAPWYDTDRNGCNQRDDVLMRDLERGAAWLAVEQGRCDHDVVAGTWIDRYTSEQLTFTDLKDTVQASAIPIDHVVALASAWRYGARGWTADRRLVFANDLDNLQPTSRSVNSAKGDKDAAAWRPKRAFQCTYATRYIQIKLRYDLPVDRSEKSALKDMIHTCAGS
jgi:hypothetical protein